MKIKFTDSVAGANWSYRFGEVAEVADDIAAGFIKRGQAEKVLPKDAPGIRRVKRGGKLAETSMLNGSETR